MAMYAMESINWAWGVWLGAFGGCGYVSWCDSSCRGDGSVLAGGGSSGGGIMVNTMSMVLKTV